MKLDEMSIKNALDNNDSEAMANAIDNRIKNEILELHEELKNEHDSKVLASRGIYSLTNQEKEFYKDLFSNEASSPAVAKGNILMPKTIFDRVFEDVKNNPDSLLHYIDFQNTTGASEYLVSVAEAPVAEWGDLCDEITKKLNIGFKVVNTLVNKLSCYVPYCKSILDLGYEWQDRYVREYMKLGLERALTTAVVSGNGSKRPHGMAYNYDVETDTSTIKTAQKIKAFTKKELAPIFKGMCKNALGETRSLDGMVLVVDSESYYEKVYANNGDINANGLYVTLLDQLGIKVIVCETGLGANKAILGLPKRYFLEVAMKNATDKFIEFSDDAMFLQDKRVYKAKMYADGFAKDKTAFALLDLSDLGKVAAGENH